jgi:AcrR family transcriptional regulator
MGHSNKTGQKSITDACIPLWESTKLNMDKKELLEFSIANFTKFGSKSITMDELATKLGISKKTLYQHFRNKEELVTESLAYLLDNMRSEVGETISKEHKDPLYSILLIYEIAFRHLEVFNPSFLFGLQKYYPSAHKVFEDFRSEMVCGLVLDLLKKAQELGQIRSDVNLELVCEMYLWRVEHFLFSKVDMFETYSKEMLIEHLITNNLRGILAPGYLL